MVERRDISDPPPDFSIVSPVYGAPEALPELFERIAVTMRRIGRSFEVILVDDHCPQNSWAVIRSLAEKHKEVVGVRLSRNFGQHPAIYAGLRLARGAWIVVMDCDLQDQPEEIEKLYAEALKGFDVVRARRASRQDTSWRRMISQAFYATLTYMTGVKHSAEIANFGVYNKKVIDAVLSWNEDHRWFAAAVQWIGFSTSDIEVVHAERRHGQSSYNLLKLIRIALQIIVSFSDRPLRLIAQTGLVIALLSFMISIIYLGMALFRNFGVPGWASIIISLWFIGGVLIFAVGFLGIYIGQVLREAKGRPNYVIDVVVRSPASGAGGARMERGDREAARGTQLLNQ